MARASSDGRHLEKHLGEPALAGPVGSGTADLYDIQGKWIHRWNLPITNGSSAWMLHKNSGATSRARFLAVRADGRKQVFSVVH